MTEVGQRERETQTRALNLFGSKLGYSQLGNWEERADNRNIEEDLLRTWLAGHGVDPALAKKAVAALVKASYVGGVTSLYDANREVYRLLRYGAKVKPDVGEHDITVPFIDWKHPEKNHFAVAEEVTVAGKHDKRPDVVLYVNGIALAVLELKRSTVSVTEGIRQNLDNQKAAFIKPFFATVQLIMAGNDTEGLRYGVIETTQKYYLTWKEDTHSKAANSLDRSLLQICDKARFLEIIHDFMVFDMGQKKTCRHNQYFGVKAAQVRVRQDKGGIIWHTQGSGKSLTMVWLANWIKENIPDSRILLITDRDELDEQIEGVFKGVGEKVHRTKSGADLIATLNQADKSLICSLIHKFGRSDADDLDQFLADIQAHLPKGFKAKGKVFVFVDECHRTQSGKLHEAMKGILPGVVFIGFTGTPLLKNDKATSKEIFGPYIHTYKYDEAVKDKVVLDLCYEARDIDQRLTSPERVDEWFKAKTAPLTDVAKAALKKRWGTMQKVLSSEPRLKQIAADIMLDMETKPRLSTGRGNALLVTGSIYQACKYYELLRPNLGDKVAIVTSYTPSIADIKGEDAGEGEPDAVQQYATYRKMLGDFFQEDPDKAVLRVDEYETEVKRRFVKEPAQMKLLIVVAKLLTGFDAPPATYLYIDKDMRDHGLFQAICRVNRLDPNDNDDGDVKDYGVIIDYKDLFESLEGSVKDYTSEALDGYDPEDVDGLLKDRLKHGKQKLDEARETIKALCEAVQPPKGTAQYMLYFCGHDLAEEERKATEQRRVKLYRITSAFVRAYTNIANEMGAAGYTKADEAAIKAEVAYYSSVRDEIRLASGDYIDLKMYEPAMRHLLDTYIQADPSKKVSAFDDMTLVQLISEKGAKAIEDLPAFIHDTPEAVAETIENNVRKVISDERGVNPKYYEDMSKVLEALIEFRKKEAKNYKEYLRQILELAKKVNDPAANTSYPPTINTKPLQALYDNLGKDASLAVLVDGAIRTKKKADWRGNPIKEREVRLAIRSVLGASDSRLAAIYEIATRQHDY